MTEAGPMGLGMYLRLGFRRVGIWKVPTKGKDEFLTFPVLKLEVKDTGASEREDTIEQIISL
jgi:hypothetical protein